MTEPTLPSGDPSVNKTDAAQPTPDNYDEPVLADDYPVYCGYLYVADGRVIVSDIEGDVARLKRDTGAREIRRCDIVGRQEAASNDGGSHE